MIARKRLFSNAALSVTQVIVSGILLFFLYRYLLRTLGAEQLGLWSVLLASTSIVRLSDLGLTASVVKFVASHRARGDNRDAALSVQTVGLSLLVLVGILLGVLYPLISGALEYFLPADALSDGIAILPHALGAFWISSLGGAFQAGLDGCQEARTKNAILIVASVVFFLLSISLVHRFGLMALAIAQVFQAVLVTIASWLALRRFLPELPCIPWQWSRVQFREMFSYSAHFQMTSVAAMLIDPLTKALMSKYGGLSTAAYYEMASQLVIKARALLVSANQVMVPVVAEAHVLTPGRGRSFYSESYKAVFFAAVIVYSALVLILPSISYLWIGHFEQRFVLFGSILSVTYFINNIEVPAHFDNLGTGRLGWNTIANVGMAVSNAVLGALLGQMLGGVGVAIALAASISLGSVLVLWVVHHRYGIPTSELLPKEHRFLAIITAPTVIFLAVVQWIYSSRVGVSSVVTFMVFGAWAAALSAVISVHPYRKFLAEVSPKMLRARAGRG